MCGFLDATHQRLAKLPATSRATIVLPSYSSARKATSADPAAGHAAGTRGAAVLLHGMRTEARRVLASDVLEALDIKALAAPETIANGQVAHPHPAPAPRPGAPVGRATGGGPAQPRAQRGQVDEPCAGPAVVVTAYTHPEYLDMLHATFTSMGMTALLSRGLEGEVATDPRRTPRYDAFVAASTSYWKNSNLAPPPKCPACPPKSTWPPRPNTRGRCWQAPCRCPGAGAAGGTYLANVSSNFLRDKAMSSPTQPFPSDCPPAFGHGWAMQCWWARGRVTQSCSPSRRSRPSRPPRCCWWTTW